MNQDKTTSADEVSSSRLVRRIPPRYEWNWTKPMWVIGTIDSHGAIRGRAAHDDSMHGPEDGPGRRWRWNVWSGEFHAVLGGRDNLTTEEAYAVEDWLEKRGYIYPPNGAHELRPEPERTNNAEAE